MGAQCRAHSAWDEIQGVFGNGDEYDWALEDGDELPYEEEQPKPDMKYQDVNYDALILVFS